MVSPIDIIESVRDHRHQERGLRKIKGLMIHRCGVDLKTGKVLGYTGLDVALAFIGGMPEVAKYTGSQNPYTFMINAGVGAPWLDGLSWQCLPLDEIGWHARSFSRGWVGLAWIGDPRVQPVSEAGYREMVALSSGLCDVLGLDPLHDIKGHGEEPRAHGGGKAPGQPGACPGLSQAELDRFRQDVHDSGEIQLDITLSKE